MDCRLLTTRVSSWLARARPARILHLFDQACNLIDRDGEVIAVVSTAIGPGPFSMVVDYTTFAALNVSAKVLVDPAAGKVMIGSLSIRTDRASLWNAIPDWRAAASSDLLDHHQPSPLWPPLSRPFDQLLAGIGEGDVILCRKAASQLAGLGQGLTPAGDDLLMGAIYGLWVWKPDIRLVRAIVEAAVPRTTALSAAFLSAAADAEATIHWHNLINGEPKAVTEIQAIGYSSGRDAWAGFLRVGHYLSA